MNAIACVHNPLRSAASVVLVLLCTALGVGCTGGGRERPISGSDGGTMMAPPPPPSLSCLEVLQCIVECPDGDMPCLDGCYAQGTPQAMSEVYDLGTCIDTNACVEETCVTSNCATELSVCVGASVPPSMGTPLPAAPPPGSVPADLVGSWAGASMGSTERLIINADATGSRMFARTTRISACYSYTSLTKTGSFVIDDTTITLYATSVEQSVRECAPPDEITSLPPVVEVTRWSRGTDANTILIVDAACAAMYPGTEGCDTLGCPISLYCTYRLTRE